MTKDIFDFSDLSDLPEELASKLTSDTDASERAWADIVAQGAARGFTELSINQIIAVATRMGLEVPTQTTVRNWLNKAAARGLISKPTRMTYGPAGAASAAPVEGEADEADAAEPKAPKGKGKAADTVATPPDDPLAGLV